MLSTEEEVSSSPLTSSKIEEEVRKKDGPLPIITKNPDTSGIYKKKKKKKKKKKGRPAGYTEFHRARQWPVLQLSLIEISLSFLLSILTSLVTSLLLTFFLAQNLSLLIFSFYLFKNCEVKLLVHMEMWCPHHV
jgi:hypothetical protein